MGAAKGSMGAIKKPGRVLMFPHDIQLDAQLNGPPTAAWIQLTSAIKNHDESAVRELIALKANINERNGRYNTPLFIALQTQSVSMIKLLLELGSNISLDKEALRSYLLVEKNQDNPDLLFCLEWFYRCYQDDVSIQNKINKVKECHEAIWLNTKKVIEKFTPIPSDVLNNIIKEYDCPLNRLSLFNKNEKQLEIKSHIQSSKACIIL